MDCFASLAMTERGQSTAAIASFNGELIARIKSRAG